MDHGQYLYGAIDAKGQTLLHYCCEYNQNWLARMTVEFMFGEHSNSNIRQHMEEHSPENRPTLMEYINLKSREGLTCIHYAAFWGNNRMIEYLVARGANAFVKDNHKHSLMHIAAQGDQVNCIYYILKNLAFDINEWDMKLSTPLHWAAYLQHEVGLCFLLAWGANPNLYDKDGNTPLHLAVLRSKNSTRCVRILLLKGASRAVINHNGEWPIDKAETDELW